MEQVRKLLAVTDDSQRAVRDSCRKHLTTIFTNIINNPAELKYRKIREQNQILSQELFGFENATDILEIAGFDRTGAKSANGASWVFMATPEDSEALSVLQGVLDVLIDEKKKIQDDIRVQVLSEDDDHSSHSRSQSEENRTKNNDSNTNTNSNNDNNNNNNNNNNVNREEIPPELLAAARQAFGQQQQQSQSQSQSQPETNSNNQQPQLAPKFFSFARSVGFQMRLEALQAAQEQQKEYQQHQDAAENDDNNDNNNSSPPLQSFLVEQLLDTRNSDVISETLRIIRVLIDNMRKDPAEAKYRLLKFDNQMLSKYFFPVSGAPELFIGLLGFSLSDEGLAKKIDNAQDGGDETKAFEKVGEVLKKVEEGLQLRRELENQERRRLAKELMKDDIEEERRRQGLHSSSKKQQQGNNDDDAAQQQKPKKKIPISEVLNYLLGKPTEVDED